MKSVAQFSWPELIQISRGEAVSHHRPFEQASVDTDTRTLDAASFFVPLTGPKFDGNQFIEQAYAAGAQGAPNTYQPFAYAIGRNGGNSVGGLSVGGADFNPGPGVTPAFTAYPQIAALFGTPVNTSGLDVIGSSVGGQNDNYYPAPYPTYPLTPPNSGGSNPNISIGATTINFGNPRDFFWRPSAPAYHYPPPAYPYPSYPSYPSYPGYYGGYPHTPFKLALNVQSA
jgi:hypothetical protein